MERENDFSQGSIAKNILNLAVPMTLAQLINVLYSVVDRVYIGHLQGVSANALTGIGLHFRLLQSSRHLLIYLEWEEHPFVPLQEAAMKKKRQRR